VEEVKRLLAMALLSSIACSSFSQTVCIAGNKACVEAQKKACASERAEANLDMVVPSAVQGVAKDPSGAFLKGYLVQVRDVASGTTLQSAAIDANGQFNIAHLAQGKYRFIIVTLSNGKIVRPPLFDQPSALRCDGSEMCNLNIVLKLHGTDNPVDFCPPK
jgi:hypothetical protein